MFSHYFQEIGLKEKIDILCITYKFSIENQFHYYPDLLDASKEILQIGSHSNERRETNVIIF